MITKLIVILIIWGNSDGIAVQVRDMEECTAKAKAIERNANTMQADCLAIQIQIEPTKTAL